MKAKDMSGINQIWTKIANIGVDESVGPSEVKYISLLNILAFVTSLLVLGYLPVFIQYLPQTRLFLYICLVLIPLNLIVLLLNHFKHYLIARLYFGLLAVITFILLSLLAGHAVNIHLYLILVIIGTFFIYPSREKTVMYSMIVIALGSFVGLEVWFFSHDGLISLSPELVRTIATVDNTGLIIFVLGFSFYIYTIYFRAEKKLLEKQEEIKKNQRKLVQAEKLAALGRLTADIAHEIRNPLTSLGGFGHRLQKKAIASKEKEYADIIVSEVDRLEHILRDVLTFSREAQFHFERLPVADVVESSINTFADLCSDNNIKVERIIDTNLSVLIDAEQVRQAVNNLISNAIDAMPEGGDLKVHVVQDEQNSVPYISICVSDTGPGIPDQQLPLIFEPFHTTKEIGHGTGLGLSISRKIIEEHGGFIRAETRKEGGLTVSLHFPYQSEEEMTRTPCWRFMKCGRDTDSELKCPAYPHFGRVCWAVAGTFSEGKVQGTFAQKYEDCRKCEFYKKVLTG